MPREFAMVHELVLDQLTPKGWTKKLWVRGPVRVMARSEGYAMVRFKGCGPFVVREKDLRPVPKD